MSSTATARVCDMEILEPDELPADSAVSLVVLEEGVEEGALPAEGCLLDFPKC